MYTNITTENLVSTHSEKVIDILRFCIRRDTMLSKYLDKDFASFDSALSNQMYIAQTDSVLPIAPQPIMMEMDTQSRLHWLLSKEVSVSEFENTLDGIVGDSQNILAEFVDWESSSSAYTFNELRSELCVVCKFKFDATKVYLFGLFYACKESKKEWIMRTSDIECLDYDRHPKTI